MPNIFLKVEEGQLQISNENGCNFLRDYGLTKVFVTTPNLTEIRNSSGYTVTSIGALNFPQLAIMADDSSDEVDYHTDGDYDLQINTAQLNVITNGFANIKLSGTATLAFYGIYAGHSSINAGELITDEVSFFHRGSNNLVVNPQQSLEGTLVSIGNVISKNEPSIVNVDQQFEGRLIFE